MGSGDGDGSVAAAEGAGSGETLGAGGADAANVGGGGAGTAVHPAAAALQALALASLPPPLVVPSIAAPLVSEAAAALASLTAVSAESVASSESPTSQSPPSQSLPAQSQLSQSPPSQSQPSVLPSFLSPASLPAPAAALPGEAAAGTSSGGLPSTASASASQAQCASPSSTSSSSPGGALYIPMTAISGWADPQPPPITPLANSSLAADVIADVAGDVARIGGIPSEPLLGAPWSPDGRKYLLALCSTGGRQVPRCSCPPAPLLRKRPSHAPLRPSSHAPLYAPLHAPLCACHPTQMSNHLFCLREFALMAGALNRTLVVPMGPHELTLPLSLVFDVPFLRACYGPMTALTLDEYKQFVSHPCCRAAVMPHALVCAVGRGSMEVTHVLCLVKGCHLVPDAGEWGAQRGEWQQVGGKGLHWGARAAVGGRLHGGNRAAPVEISTFSPSLPLPPAPPPICSSIAGVLRPAPVGQFVASKGRISLANFKASKGRISLANVTVPAVEQWAWSGLPDKHSLQGAVCVGLFYGAVCVGLVYAFLKVYSRVPNGVLMIGEFKKQPITDSIFFRMLSPMDLPFLLPPPPGKQRGRAKPAKVVPRETCLVSPAIRPPEPLIAAARHIVQLNLLNGQFLAVQFRRGDFKDYCQKKQQSDGCFLPVDQAAQCMRAAALTARVPLVFLATNARPHEVAAIAATLLEAPQEKSLEVAATAAAADTAAAVAAAAAATAAAAVEQEQPSRKALERRLLSRLADEHESRGQQEEMPLPAEAPHLLQGVAQPTGPDSQLLDPRPQRLMPAIARRLLPGVSSGFEASLHDEQPANTSSGPDAVDGSSSAVQLVTLAHLLSKEDSSMWLQPLMENGINIKTAPQADTTLEKLVCALPAGFLGTAHSSFTKSYLPPLFNIMLPCSLHQGINIKTTPQAVATLEKLMCALGAGFLGTAHSTFTNDIVRLRHGFRTARCSDDYICSAGPKEG
ncbi:unnamed protein product [Closterium sp. Naga37s-1]|nr:unnamed protein product [Closterium sp. Naga37s-1]